MARLRLGMVALVAASACGQIEREPLGPMTMGGADTSGAGASSVNTSGAGTSSVNTSDAGSGGVGSGGRAGSGGLSQVQSAVAECQHYCETLDYQLPQALCEDWNRPEWDPQFCRAAGPTSSCADYCVKVYEIVTPACAARLEPAIRCVAPTYASVSLPPSGACWLGDCRAQLFSMTSACYGLAEGLAAARATWEASRVTDYQLTYSRSGDAKAQVVVRTGSEPVVTPADAFAWTVPKLFDAVERTLQEPGVAPRVSYDANLGYVVDLAREQGCAGASAQVTGIEVAPFR